MRMLNDLGVAQANEVGSCTYIGVPLIGNNEPLLVKVSSGDFTAPFNYLGFYKGEMYCMSFNSSRCRLLPK